MSSHIIETNSKVKEGSQDSLTQKKYIRTCLQVRIHGQWMLPSLMRSFVGQSSIRELCPPAFNELTVDLLLPVCYNRIHIYICICIPGALIAWRFKQNSTWTSEPQRKVVPSLERRLPWVANGSWLTCVAQEFCVCFSNQLCSSLQNFLVGIRLLSFRVWQVWKRWSF